MAGRNTEPFKVVGRRLAALRDSHGLSQRKLAERLGQPQSYVGKLELAERRLDLMDLAALANAFTMTPAQMTNYLLGNAEAQEESRTPRARDNEI